MWQFIIWICISLIFLGLSWTSGYRAKDAWDKWHNNKTPLVGVGGKGGDAIASSGGTAIGGNGGPGGGPEAGQGGDGGDATASNGGIALGGDGGPGGGPGGGDGGDGGNAVNKYSSGTFYGGDGGGGFRGDGRGGEGAKSSLTKIFSPEELERLYKMGVPRNAGAGGNGGNTPEYNRRVEVLQTLSKEYSDEYPEKKLTPMLDVNMPPIGWINTRLEEIKETFRIRLIDNNTDFWLDSVN